MGQDTAIFDLFVVGGGINGCGIARDAAGRGYSVALAEMNDLASATSSGSTKLIHGGLRYLEFYEFRLVRESLLEREVLWRMAPHIIWPLRFVLPHHKGMRPAWLLRLGLFLYDQLGGRQLLPGARSLDMQRDPAGEPLQPLFTRGFEYSDCWVNDARLVILNARDAAARGARIMTRTCATAARRDGDHWQIDTRSADGRTETYRARMLVNAAGPWVDQVIGRSLGRNDVHNVRLVQGSHIVVPRLFDHERCYFFQNQDGRIFFAIPYERDFTLIGTTDRDYDDDPARVAITPEETAYLCEAANAYFRKQIGIDDVVWSYSAVRPLFDDGASKAQEATRDYVLKCEGGAGEAPLLNVFGGKITTYRRLAESALDEVAAGIGPRGAPWTAGTALPGGDFPVDGFDARVAALQSAYPFIAPDHAHRLVRLYGSEAETVLQGARSLPDLGPCFGANLTAAEVDYLVREEWAVTAEDILWRRTKLGLRLSQDEVAKLEDHLAAAAPASGAGAVYGGREG